MNSLLQDSELIEFSKAVELAATEVLDGMHVSARGGQGIEYHSTLPYADGEDARRIDWKRVAATDRYYVNRFEREAKSSWTLLIDRSSSMTYGQKLKWVSQWAGALIFLAKIWGDRWRLLPNHEGDVEEAFQILTRNQAGVLEPESLKLEGRASERLVVFSDFFWGEEKVREAIRKWQGEFVHIYLLQILDPKESAFGFSGVTEFRDLESSDRLILDAGRMAARYRKSLKKLQETLRTSLQEGSFSMTFEAGQVKLKDQLLNFFEEL